MCPFLSYIEICQANQVDKNIRVAKDEVEFSTYLLTIGDGTAKVHPQIGQDMIQISEEYLVDTIDGLIEKVFPNIQDGYCDKYWVARRAYLHQGMRVLTR